MMEEKNAWKLFCSKIDAILKDTLDKEIIIFGSNPDGEFIKWYYEHFYQKKVVAVVDRWNMDNHYLVHHLMSLYYLWTENAVIINTLPDQIGPKEEFCNIGEVWERTKWTEGQIISLHRELYQNANEDRYITFYDWLEGEYGVDILASIRRGEVKGNEAHGYYPTDFRLILDLLSLGTVDRNTAIMDFGCGKGATMMALRECGFRKIGGIEYTDGIYDTMCSNLGKMGWQLEKCTDKTIHKGGLEEKFYCYLGDASALEDELDQYHNFYFFNPFSYTLTETVLGKIFESMKKVPRKAYIFYAEPMCHEVIMESGVFHLVRSVCFGGNTYSANVYESVI